MNQCSACHGFCDGCTNAGNTFCSACDADKYSVENTNTCVEACSDYASNYYLDDPVCRECDDACATCGGGEAFNCVTCTGNYKEVIDSPSKDPKHCVSSCGTGTYEDGSVCRGKLLMSTSLCIELSHLHKHRSDRLLPLYARLLCPPYNLSLRGLLSQWVL